MVIADIYLTCLSRRVWKRLFFLLCIYKYSLLFLFLFFFLARINQFVKTNGRLGRCYLTFPIAFGGVFYSKHTHTHTQFLPPSLIWGVWGTREKTKKSAFPCIYIFDSLSLFSMCVLYTHKRERTSWSIAVVNS